MRFLFVDKITKQSGNTITGSRLFSADEPLRYISPGGTQRIAPGIVSEAIGQLASWKCIKDNGFTARPVFLFADKIKVYGDVAPGTVLDLQAELHEVNGETFRFSGQAMKNGTVVQVISDCSGYFIPLAELEDPAVTRSRYESLINGGLSLISDSQAPYNFFNLVKDDFVVEPGKSITARVSLSKDEPFYADHFPRMPVTPIVVLNELIGAVACILDSGRKERGLSVRKISGIKIKSFVRPGDDIDIKVSVNGADRHSQSPVSLVTDAVETTADIFCGGKRILRGNYVYLSEGNT